MRLPPLPWEDLRTGIAADGTAVDLLPGLTSEADVIDTAIAVSIAQNDLSQAVADGDGVTIKNLDRDLGRILRNCRWCRRHWRLGAMIDLGRR